MVFQIRGRNRFITVILPNGFKMTAELAVNEGERAKGLMFREEISPDYGMLFVFKKERKYSFWMKNMKIPIDIIWLDKEKRIVHMEENVPPCDDIPCPSYFPEYPARYVFELKAGSIKKQNLELFDKLKFLLPDNLKFFN